MSSEEVSKISKAEHDELCCSYAAMILHDDGLEITGEKLSYIIKASNNEVEPHFPTLFAKALKTSDVGKMIDDYSTDMAILPSVSIDQEKLLEQKKEE